MPEESGWYWCVGDNYQSGLYVQVVMDTEDTTIAQVDTQDSTPVDTPATYITPVVSSPSTTLVEEAPVFVPLSKSKGNADQLSIYQTYDRKWSDHQVTISTGTQGKLHV